MSAFFTHTTVHLLSFFFNDTATTEIYTLSLHDALPISRPAEYQTCAQARGSATDDDAVPYRVHDPSLSRSEEHTSELQSHVNLVCRLLLEKKKKYKTQSCEFDDVANDLIRLLLDRQSTR